MGKLGIWELLLIFGVALVIFGPSKLPELGESMGKAIRAFKGEIDKKADSNEDDSNEQKGS